MPEKMVVWFKHHGVQVECVQTNNRFEFTSRFSNNRREIPTRFKLTAARLGIQHRLIRPYTPRPTAKWKADTAKTRNVSTINIVSSLLPILVCSELHTKITPITYLGLPLVGLLLKKNLLHSFLLCLFKMFDKPTILYAI